jgi:hypothetical protein
MQYRSSRLPVASMVGFRGSASLPSHSCLQARVTAKEVECPREAIGLPQCVKERQRLLTSHVTRALA